MIDRGYQVATRLFQQKGLVRAGDSKSNMRLLFAHHKRFIDFPQKGTPYFKELVNNQIKSAIGLSEKQQENQLTKIAR